MDEIKLNYPLKVLFYPGMEEILNTDRAVVFVDEHGRQWIKFIAKNGPNKGEEHIVRTHGIVLVHAR
jgi:hypothetical protein